MGFKVDPGMDANTKAIDSTSFSWERLFSVLTLVFMVISPNNALGLCVKTDKAFLRNGPGGKNKKTWTVGKYTPLISLKWNGLWAKVQDVDDEVHWVYGGLVTSRFSCLTIKTKSANLRTGPGTKYGLADTPRAEKYMSFKRIDQEDDWFKIEDVYRQQFWVHRSQVWRPLKVSRVSF